MGDDDSSLLTRFCSTVNAVLNSQVDDKLRHILQNICPIVFFHALSATVTRHVNCYQCSRFLQVRVASNVSPHSPTIWEPMNKDHQRLAASQHLLGIGNIVAKEMELKPSGKSQEMVGESSIVLRQIPQSIMSCTRLGDILVGNWGEEI